MSTSIQPAHATPTSAKGGRASASLADKSLRPRDQFLNMALTMSWQLAIVVLVPVIGGVYLGKAVGAQVAWTIVGLVLAVLGTGVVLWRTLQTANRLPVPKLTAAQKRAVQKGYEEDDKDD
ncbi:MAG: AtpZ/AtpI family protein [Candidatus Saccharibacteria bacterium]